MEQLPSPNVSNGHDANGRFAKGNRLGRGNPYARQTSDIRRTVLETVSNDDLVAIIQSLIKRAKAGDVAASKELLDRMLGKPKATVAVETEPRYDPEDAKAKLKAMMNADPSLHALFSEMVGVKALPGGTPPKAVAVVD